MDLPFFDKGNTANCWSYGIARKCIGVVTTAFFCIVLWLYTLSTDTKKHAKV